MITMLNIDCMEYMKTVPDKYFDLAIVDPPYGIGGDIGTGGYSRGWLNNERKYWDKVPTDYYFAELKRVSVNYIVWGGNYFVLPISRGWICWYKTDEVKGRDFSEFELAWTSFDLPARHFEERPFIRNGNRVHPTQKPVALYKWLLKNYAKPEMKILDTHGGSFSSAIACYDFGTVEYVGCELDKDYYDAAVKRFNYHKSQVNMFEKNS